MLDNPTLLNYLKSRREIDDEQISQLRQLLPGALGGQQAPPLPPQTSAPPPNVSGVLPPSHQTIQFNIPGLGGNNALAGSPAQVTAASAGGVGPGSNPPGFMSHFQNQNFSGKLLLTFKEQVIKTK